MKKTIVRVKGGNTGLRKDRAKNYISTDLVKLKNKYKFYTRLLTCVHNPNNISIRKAWEEIDFDLDKIKRILMKKEYNILFSVMVVEVHEGKEVRRKKEETTNEKKEIKHDKVEEAHAKLKGYPHIHTEIFFISPDGKVNEMSEIIGDIRRETSFSSGDDIKIDGGEKKKGRNIEKSDENFLCYVLKNANHAYPDEAMKIVRQGREKRIEEEIGEVIGEGNCFFIDNSNDKDVIDFIEGLQKRGILIDIPDEKKKIDEVKKEMILAEHVDNGARTGTKREEGFNVSMAAVVYYMNSNDLRLCGDHVYNKVEGTRRSYEYWGTMNMVYGCLYKPTNNKIILTLIDNKHRIMEVTESANQEYIPTIVINWNYMECKDCYIHLSTYAAIKGEIPDDIVCVHLNQTISYKDFDRMKNPDRWLKHIMDQPFAEDKKRIEKFFESYYCVALPMIQKYKPLCLYGPPNTCKSSTMEPINRLFPRQFKTQITQGKFGISDIKDKRLLALDDVNNASLESINMLQLFEGGRDIMQEKKGVNAFNERYEGNLYMCTNEFPDKWMRNDEIMGMVLKDQYETRLEIFKFETKIKKEEMKPGFMKRVTAEEIGRIIMFTGSFYAKNFLERDSGLLIYDTYGECRQILRDHEAIFEM